MNMYDILEKLRKIKLTEEVPPAQNKTINEDAEPLSRLDEKYMGWKKTVSAIKKGGSAEDPEAVAAAIGRKKYGKEKFQKAAAAGKKLGEGEVEESGLQAYLGKKKYGEKGMKALQQAGREGASKEKMARIRAKHDKMDEANEPVDPAKDKKGTLNKVKDFINKAVSPKPMHQKPFVEAAKPDFLDLDKDGNKKEPMKKAAKEKVKESTCNECGMYESKCKCSVNENEQPRLSVKRGPQGTEVTSTTGRVKATMEPGKPTKIEPGKKVGEGMINATVDDILRKHRRDVKRFQKAGDLSNALYGDLYAHFKHQMPYGTVTAKTGDPYEWIANKLDSIIKVPEGNAFGNAVRQAKMDGVQKGEKVSVGGKEYPLKEKMSPAKAKKFAALAEPKDKITYADKIAGAKRSQTDETTLWPGTPEYKAKHGEPDMKKGEKKKSSTGGEIEKTSKGVKHIARDRSEEPDTDEPKSGEKRSRGRPKKYSDEKPRQERITARSRKKDRTAHGQTGFKTDKKKKSKEVEEAMSVLKNSGYDVSKLEEKAVSQQQQKFMGMAHAMQKGEKIKGASPELKKVAKSMKKGDVKDFAKTKHAGLPKRVKQGKPVDEEMTDVLQAEKPYRDPKSGKMVTPPKGATQPPADSKFAPGDPRNAKPVKPAKKEESVKETDANPTDAASKKSKGGMQFGKGIYDSMNRELENMIAENMSINTSLNSDGTKSISINATDEDADKLAAMLKMAGLEGRGDHHDDGICPSCASPECECDMIDEVTDNKPDYPENMGSEQDEVYMIKTLSGGLNRPKVDQTVMPHTLVKTQKDDMLEAKELALWNKLKRM